MDELRQVEQMETFSILDGRTYFYQWDLNQKIKVNDETITEVHFCNGATECSLVCKVTDGAANVPNILLQTAGKIRLYAVKEDHTETEKIYEVRKRSKPEDYVYTETEVLRYETLEKRISAFEENGLNDLFVINLHTEETESGGLKRHDYTYSEIQKALEDGKLLLLRDINGKIYTYSHTITIADANSKFIFRAAGKYVPEKGLIYEALSIDEDYKVHAHTFGKVDDPIKTPNPKKLVFTDENGETALEYDGSEEKAVRLITESDLEAATEEGEYELVNTFEYVEEDQRVIVSTTDDGRKWYFSEVFCEIKLNGNELSESRNLNAWGYPGFEESICGYAVSSGSSGQKAQMRVYAKGGVWNAECSPMSANELRPTTQFWRGFNPNKTTERLPAISGVSASNWPVGTVLRIWGVWGKDA